MLEKKTLDYEKAVLIGVINKEQDEEKVTEYLDELAFLTYTAGGEAIKRFVQRIDMPNPKTYIGAGKMEEVKTFVDEHKVGTLFLMTNSHQHNKKTLKSYLNVKCSIELV